MRDDEYRALEIALASARMEGFSVTKQTETDCVRLLTGKVSVAELVQEIMNRSSEAV